MPLDPPANTLYYGDNLDIMRRYLPDESVDLIYLDPPFNSNRNYNVLFKEQNGTRAASQIRAFEDTWTWNQEAEAVYADLVTAGGRVADALEAFRKLIGECDMLAYLVMMAPRLQEMRRVLKNTGSIYLHCDPTASHYLKLLMDAVFGLNNYRNEIIWQRTFAGKPIYRNLPKNIDIILWFTKTDEYFFSPIRLPLTEEDKKTFNMEDGDGRGPYNTQPIINPGERPNLKYIYTDLKGRDWHSPNTGWRFNKDRMRQLELDRRLVFGKTSIREKYYLREREKKGKQIPNVWSDIPIVSQEERLGYPTQKPEALIERIISASSREGDMVLDPFCGCGTTIAAAQKLNRRWIGIDITHLAITLMKKRLKDTFGDSVEFRVIGEPVSVPDAEALAKTDPYQFQWWALGLVGARPVEGKKGADKGIDGRIIFQGDKPGSFESVILSVKAGKTGLAHVLELKGVLDREKAALGVLISMQEPTSPMKTEAVTTGFYESTTWGRKYPKVQLLTVAELLAGKQIDMPPIKQVGATFKKAPKASSPKAENMKIPFEK